MPTDLMEKPGSDVRGRIRAGASVALIGSFASMPRAELGEIVQAHGARYVTKPALNTSLVVVGQKDWPLNASGMLPEALRVLRVRAARGNMKVPVVSEEQFLREMGLSDHAANVHPLYSTTTLTELLGVARDSVRGWVKAGLLEPAQTVHGVWYFDFRQATAAKTLCELARRGVSLNRMRKSLEQLRGWLPEADQPLEQLSVLERDGALMVRLAEGALAAADGQLVLDFDHPAAAAVAGAVEEAEPRLRIGPDTRPGEHVVHRTASDWFALGVEQHAAGLLDEAVASFREALLAGGPDAQTCFDLAAVLHALGRRPEAIERYRQAVEVDPRFGDAWNNLGTVLAEAGLLDEACAAFRRAISISPDDGRAHYNLADTLDDMGLSREAAAHWKAYLRHDTASQWAAHARKRLAAV
jgi:tetratricopeptide (TPR) repeat protein